MYENQEQQNMLLFTHQMPAQDDSENLVYLSNKSVYVLQFIVVYSVLSV